MNRVATMRGPISMRLALRLLLVSLSLALLGCAGSSVTSAPKAGGQPANDRTIASTGTLVYSLAVTPVVAAPRQVVFATATYLNTSRISTLTVGGDSFFAYHLTVTAADGKVVFDSEPNWAVSSFGHMAIGVTLAPGATSSKTATFSVSTPGVYSVVADEQMYDMAANRSMALTTPPVRIVVGNGKP